MFYNVYSSSIRGLSLFTLVEVLLEMKTGARFMNDVVHLASKVLVLNN
jgi:hypothetical protein